MRDLDTKHLFIIIVARDPRGTTKHLDECDLLGAHAAIDARELIERVAVSLVGLDHFAPCFDRAMAIARTLAELCDLGIGSSLGGEVLLEATALAQSVGERGPLAPLPQDRDQRLERSNGV